MNLELIKNMKKKIEVMRDEYDKSVIYTNSILKCVKILQGKIQVSNEEIEDLITYFEEKGHSNLCNSLKNFIK
jgi:hypothetical protein